MESEAHMDLKEIAVEDLKSRGFTEEEIEKEYTLQAHDIRIDVVAISDERSVAIECGKINGDRSEKKKRKEILREEFGSFKHYSFLKTSKTRSQSGKKSRLIDRDLSEEEKYERTSTSIYDEDAKKIQIIKIENGLDNAQEAIEHILDKNEALKEKVEELEGQKEELQEKLEENQ